MFTRVFSEKSHFTTKNKVLIVFLILGLAITFGLTYLKYNNLSTANAQLLKEFPKIPVYPNARLITTATDPYEGEKYNGVKYSATWSVPERVSDVSKWYVTNLDSEGWTLNTRSVNQDANDVQLITLNNESYTLNLSIVRDDSSNLTHITSEISTKLSDFREPGESE